MKNLALTLAATVLTASFGSSAFAQCHKNYGGHGFQQHYAQPYYGGACHQQNYHFGFNNYLPCTYNSWAKYCYFPQHQCYGYYSSSHSCWYYYYQPKNCFLPVQYMNQFTPTANININNNTNINTNVNLPAGATTIPGGLPAPVPGAVK